MKKKLISLVFGAFMAIFSVFSLAGCSLVSTNTELKNKKVVLTIGDAELTRSDIISSFYTYYQNNNSYFSYYDNETIEESFYTWAIIKEVINQKSAEAIYDADTNPDGFIIFTQKNHDNVWKNTYNYIYNQISSYEKNVYTSAGYAEENLPVWISGETEDAAETKFEAYEKIDPEGVCLNDPSQASKKATKEQVIERAYAEATALKKYLFEHVVETDDEGNETRKSINEIIAEEQKYVGEIEKNKFIENARSQAYVDYISGLVNNAKSAGKNINETELLNEEIVRVYEAYYESEITTLLQTYYLNDYLLDESGDTPLTEKAIAEAFLKDYYTDYETYQFEDAYITTMTNKDGASLVLYHYNGQNYFFTVQHILVQNDEHISADIKDIPGYTESGSFDYDASSEDSVAKQFFDKREELTNAYFMASAVNEKNVTKSINIAPYANYYFYDETRTDDNSGYIKLVKVGEGDDVKYFEDTDKDGVKDDDETTEVDKSKALYLASDEDIENCYKATYNTWIGLAKEYAGYILTGDTDGSLRKGLRDAHEDMNYVFDTVENLVKSTDTQIDVDNAFKTTLNQKVASYVFVQLEWIFSSDSLGNKLSNKMGYVMSNYPDEHGSWVAEFADGARDLIKLLKNDYDTVEEGMEAILNGNVVGKDISNLTHKIISTYGYHIIKVENVYECGSSVIDIAKIEEKLGAKLNLNVKSHVDAVIDAMKKTYVCEASNQTIYDYYFDELYTGFVGSSWLGDTSDKASSGTYFLKLEYEWLYDLYQADEVKYVNKMTYEELLSTVK